MTKNSAYVEKYAGPGEDRATRLALAPGSHKYLFIYPLTKLREWYGLPAEERQQIMNQHIAIGATYLGQDQYDLCIWPRRSGVRAGLQSDQPGDFLDLVQELRGPSRAPTRRRMCRSSPVLPRRRAACCRLSR